MSEPARFSPSFFRRDPVLVARALLGQRLVSLRGGLRTSGIIVETEAYLGIPDRAAHTFGGRRSARNQSMWRAGGVAYVYFVYGMHHCVNVVAGGLDEPVAVLLRALAPDEGLETMRLRRPAARRQRDLCSGPAKLCAALGIDRSLDGADLIAGTDLFLQRCRSRTMSDNRIATGPRVGIDYAGEWRDAPLRFRVRDDPNVSR
jgi:DNA-3-methyladenine glycosylase